MTHSVAFTHQITEHEVLGRTQGFRLVITLATPVGFADPALFVLQRVAAETEVLSHVASPEELARLAPGVVDDEGWVRRAALDLVFTCMSDALTALQDLQDEVKILCDEMEKLATDLTPPDTVVISSDA